MWDQVYVGLIVPPLSISKRVTVISVMPTFMTSIVYERTFVVVVGFVVIVVVFEVIATINSQTHVGAGEVGAGLGLGVDPGVGSIQSCN